MFRSVPERQLRGKDPITVEIEVNALSAKPLGQLAPPNIADLYALTEVPDLATGLRVRLKGFHERIARAVSDLPSGEPFAAFCGAVGDVDPSRVPVSLRDVFEAESANPKRTDGDRAHIRDLQAVWEGAEPEPFEIGAPKRVVQLPTAGEPRERRYATPRGERAPRAERAPKPPRVPPARFVADPERAAWIRQVLLERLGRPTDAGLLETVLVAGVKHRGRDRYADMTPKEVTDELKALEREGKVKHSAGRWKGVVAGFSSR
ncbi:MAG: hypothetical protein H6733_05270 [Alphaproteobacteria bacterium]|nr:hypothetical protein [Alphaproteobacteria bacterium]